MCSRHTARPLLVRPPFQERLSSSGPSCSSFAPGEVDQNRRQHVLMMVERLCLVSSPSFLPPNLVSGKAQILLFPSRPTASINLPGGAKLTFGRQDMTDQRDEALRQAFPVLSSDCAAPDRLQGVLARCRRRQVRGARGMVCCLPHQEIMPHLAEHYQ